jgi:uncharacterized protein YciI
VFAVRIARSDLSRGEARAAFLEAHKAYLRSAELRIVFSGPLSDEKGSATGALILAEVDHLEEMQRFSAGDPFVRNGVYEDVEICRWEATIDNREQLFRSQKS